MPVAEENITDLIAKRGAEPGFDRWVRRNQSAHYQPGYANVSISLKSIGRPPGDASASEMEALADVAETYGQDEIRVTYAQNLVIPHIKLRDLYAVYTTLAEMGLAGAEDGLISDMIVCPGLDYCNLANARSLPLADKIFRRFDDPEHRQDIGNLRLNISGCINACGHHHAADIGILGVNKKGVEHYQISIGGKAGESAEVGRILGPSFDEDNVVAAIERVITFYKDQRLSPDEDFAAVLARIDIAHFKEAVYAYA